MSENLTYEQAKTMLEERRKYLKKEVIFFLKKQGFITSKLTEPLIYKVFDNNIPLYIKIHYESQFTGISITSSDNLYITGSFSYGSDAYHPCVISHDLFDSSYYMLPDLNEYKSLKVETNMFSGDTTDITKKFIDRLTLIIPKFVQASKNQFNHPIAKKRKAHGLKAIEEYNKSRDIIFYSDDNTFFRYLLKCFGDKISGSISDEINKILLNLPLDIKWHEKYFGHPGYMPNYSQKFKDNFFKKLEITEMEYFRICFFLYSFLSQKQDDEDLNILFGLECKNRPVGSYLSISLYVYSLYMTHIFKAFEKDQV